MISHKQDEKEDEEEEDDEDGMGDKKKKGFRRGKKQGALRRWIYGM